jgi:cytochrome c oxidase subunit 1
MSILTIAFLSTIVWGHPYVYIGNESVLRFGIYLYNVLIAIPSAVKANYITTLWKVTG